MARKPEYRTMRCIGFRQPWGAFPLYPQHQNESGITVIFKISKLNFTTNCIIFNLLVMLKYISFHFISFHFSHVFALPVDCWFKIFLLCVCVGCGALGLLLWLKFKRVASHFRVLWEIIRSPTYLCHNFWVNSEWLQATRLGSLKMVFD